MAAKSKQMAKPTTESLKMAQKLEKHSLSGDKCLFTNF